MRVSFTAFFPRAKNHYGRRNGEPYLKPNAPAFPGRVGDCDKVARALLDALTALAWYDDDQVVDLHGRKLYAALGVAPSTFVTVTRVDPE
jgi:Holliday junction resolvase RusA-like endonuclease